MSISKDNEAQEKQAEAVDLAVALKQMKEDGMPPTGFHMMFFSEDFQNSHDCPMNQLLRKVGIVHNFEDTVKRQVSKCRKDTSFRMNLHGLVVLTLFKRQWKPLTNFSRNNLTLWCKIRPLEPIHKQGFHSWATNLSAVKKSDYQRTID